jgi:RHS repeat-associated protein
MRIHISFFMSLAMVLSLCATAPSVAQSIGVITGTPESDCEPTGNCDPFVDPLCMPALIGGSGAYPDTYAGAILAMRDLAAEAFTPTGDAAVTTAFLTSATSTDWTSIPAADSISPLDIRPEQLVLLYFGENGAGRRTNATRVVMPDGIRLFRLLPDNSIHHLGRTYVFDPVEYQANGIIAPVFMQKIDGWNESLSPEMQDCCIPDDPCCGSTSDCCAGGGTGLCCPPDDCCNDPCCESPDPCCGSTDPCCGSSDPCCGSTDPCCGSSDPCCGSTDPCCGSSDPCCGSSDPCCGTSDPCCGSSDPCCDSEDPCCGSPDPCCGSEDPCCGEDPCCETFLTAGGCCSNGDCDDDNDCCTDDACVDGSCQRTDATGAINIFAPTCLRAPWDAASPPTGWEQLTISVTNRDTCQSKKVYIRAFSLTGGAVQLKSRCSGVAVTIPSGGSWYELDWNDGPTWCIGIRGAAAGRVRIDVSYVCGDNTLAEKSAVINLLAIQVTPQWLCPDGQATAQVAVHGTPPIQIWLAEGEGCTLSPTGPLTATITAGILTGTAVVEARPVGASNCPIRANLDLNAYGHITTRNDSIPAQSGTGTTANLAGGSDDTEWGIEGNSHGCEVTGSGTSVTVHDCRESGTVYLRAGTPGSQHCSRSIALPIGSSLGGGGAPDGPVAEPGGSCPGDCDMAMGGGGSMIVASLKFELSMGLLPNGESAGRISLHRQRATGAWASPAALEFARDSGDGVEVIRDGATGALRQVKSPSGLAQITPDTVDPAKYSIEWFTNPGSLVGGVYVPSGTASMRWQFTGTDVGTQRILTIEKYEGSTLWSTHTYIYEDLTSGGIDAWSWEQQIRDGSNNVVRTETSTWTAGVGGAPAVRTHVVKDADNVVVSDIEETYTGLPVDNLLLSRTVHPGAGQDDIVTTWEWTNTSQPPSERDVRCIDTNGAWEIRDYDASRRLIRRAVKWNAESKPAGDINLAVGHTYEYLYTAATGQSTPSPTEKRPRLVIERIDNVVVGRTFYDYVEPSGGPYKDIIRVCTSTSADFNASTNLVTETEYADEHRRRPIRIQTPDGRVQVLTYTAGRLNDGDPNNPYFDTALSGHEQVSVDHLVLNSSNVAVAVAGKSLRQSRVVDAAGRTLLNETYVLPASGPPTLADRIAWTLTERDDRGRVTKETTSTGLIREIVPHTCCAAEEVTDESGILVQRETDVLERVIEVTVPAFSPTGDPARTTTYDYQAIGGLPAVTTTQSTAGETSLVSKVQTDVAGRILKSWDHANLVTEFEHGYTSAGGRTLTTTRPDSETIVTTHYPDGRMKSTSGSAAVMTEHEWFTTSGVLTHRTEVTDGSATRWEERDTDIAGRLTEVRRPGFLGVIHSVYHYDIKGRLARAQTLDSTNARLRADVYMVYDAANDLIATVSDLNNNGLELDSNLNLLSTSPDRMTRVDRSFVLDSGTWWSQQETRTFVDGTGGAESRLLSTVRRQLTGLAGPLIAYAEIEDERYGAFTTIQTFLDRSDRALTNQTVFPDGGSESTSITNGMLTQLVDRAGISQAFDHDGFGRVITTTSPRDVISTEYDEYGRVGKEFNTHGDTREFTYYGSSDPRPGRLKSIATYGATLTTAKYTYFDYDNFGRTSRIWGDNTQPIQVDFNDFGQRTALRTYRGGSAWGTVSPTWGTADVTEWEYDNDTGLLTHKTVGAATASPEVTDYSYLADGLLAQRTSPRGITTDYEYDGATRELRSVDYSDSTLDLAFMHDRLGRLDWIEQRDAGNSMVRRIDYGYNAELELSTEQFTGEFVPRTLTRTYHDSGPAGLLESLSLDSPVSYSAQYEYEELTARLEQVLGTGLPAATPDGGAWYAYRSDGNLLAGLQLKLDDTIVGLESTRQYETSRSILTGIEHERHVPATAPLAKFGYVTDDLGRRRSYVSQTLPLSPSFPSTPTLSDVYTLEFDYTDRNELSAAKKYLNDTPGSHTNPVNAEHATFAYDSAGNRSDMNLADSALSSYATANALNQYVNVYFDGAGGDGLIFSQLEYDADGNLVETDVMGDANCDGVQSSGDLGAFVQAVMDATAYAAAFPDCDILHADMNGDGVITSSDLGLYIEIAVLQSSNASTANTYIYDAENRLIELRPKYLVDGSKRTRFDYDGLGRRIRKWREEYSSSTTTWSPICTPTTAEPEPDLRYVWDGWLLLEELDGCDHDADTLPDNIVLRQYTWGADLSLTRPGVGGGGMAAGGIGGLLSVRMTQGTTTATDDRTYAYLYDGNGNVTHLVDVTLLPAGDPNEGDPDPNYGAIAASYEYDAWGRTVSAQGAMANAQPFRFSTKQYDADTGLYYYGYRYYSPRLGRWLNRDPIAEEGGLNLYGFVRNAPVDLVDPLGLAIDARRQGNTCYFHVYGGKNQEYKGSVSYKCPSQCYGGGKTVSEMEEEQLAEAIAKKLETMSNFTDFATGLENTLRGASAGVEIGLRLANAPLDAVLDAAEFANNPSASTAIAILVPGVTAATLKFSKSVSNGVPPLKPVEQAAGDTGKLAGSCRNAAEFEAYKDIMRAAMEKPAVSDPKLAKMLDDLYRPGAKVGSGSTAAAVRHELATGEKVGGVSHSQKAQNYIDGLSNWLRNNPEASPGDRAAAENVMQDMINALDGR